ncbi:uncharacterized protein LOC136072160 isoform X2 [Hydra vulgaris]|uniref:uncharacterized protein LOC136072160 isoform X2 n=1 Tax=Hydra vulgaris TaxID=6087 RepID=UPI0032E9FE4C
MFLRQEFLKEKEENEIANKELELRKAAIKQQIARTREELAKRKEILGTANLTVAVEKHILLTYSDVCAKIKEHELLHTVHYVVSHTGNMEQKFEELLKKNHRVFFEDNDFPHIGVPFIFSAHTCLDCQQGIDRNIKAKEKYRKKKNDAAAKDHYYQNNKVILQDTKKFDCPAVIHIKEIVEFPEFKLTRDTTWSRNEMSKKLRIAISTQGNFIMCRKYILVLPGVSAHKNYVIGETASLS